jgi:two-component system sensor histidine kinase DesK
MASNFAFGQLHGRLVALRDALERRLLPPVRAPGDDAIWSGLWYLLFPFIPIAIPLFGHADVKLTLLSCAVFLPLYFGSFWARDTRIRIGVAFAVALLGAGLFPANTYSNTFTVYACVMAAGMSRRQVALVFLIAQGLLAAAAFSTQSAQLASFIMVLTVLVGISATLATRFYIAKARKQHALRLSHDEISRLAKVAERERIGRDLHDLLGHTLSVIALKSELATRIGPRDAAAAIREMSEVSRIAREALTQVRRAVAGMREMGLAAELANARLALSAAMVEFEYPAQALELHPEIETVLALALREAVTNVIRHADARRCRASIAREDAMVTLRIADDGQGGARGEGGGLSGMRTRIEQIGGSLGIVTGPSGTTLEVRLPWREPPVPAIDTGTARARLRAVR